MNLFAFIFPLRLINFENLSSLIATLQLNQKMAPVGLLSDLELPASSKETLCHDPNSGRPKIWPMTPGQKFDPKGFSYSTLVINQNTLNFFFPHLNHTKVLTN